MSKKEKIVISVLFVLLGFAILFAIYFLCFYKPKLEIDPNKEPSKVFDISKLPVKKLTIMDPESKTRPIAVMINNNESAWPNHSGLQDAYLVYEIITEGGITRMMAIFKDKTTERIGSVRSSRHYFLDYALENDAIYVHFGWSPLAKQNIPELGINNVNGLYDNAFWRDLTLNVAYEHTAFTSIEGIKQVAQYRGYNLETSQETLLNYSVKKLKLSEQEGAVIANNISIPYSYGHTTSYIYDPENKVYKRYINGYEHKDAPTDTQYTTKNIITYQVGNYSIDSYGRQDINNLGSGTGYYISEGYAIPITWSKDTRSSQTIYRYLNGEELVVNDGNTYIQIQPTTEILSITE